MEFLLLLMDYIILGCVRTCDGNRSHGTNGPRWPWIANLNFLEFHSHVFSLSEKNFEEFLYKCPYRASSLNLPEPCLLTGENFANNF